MMLHLLHLLAFVVSQRLNADEMVLLLHVGFSKYFTIAQLSLHDIKATTLFLIYFRPP